MLEMPIRRTGRRLLDAARQLRGGAWSSDERMQVNSLHRQRMTCSDSMQTFTNTQDWTGSLGISPSGRFRVIEETKPKRKIFSRDGIRWDAAWIILAAVTLIFIAVLLADVAGMGMGSRTISRLNLKIADMNEKNNLLKQEIARDSADVSVCMEAVELNLIAGSGAQTIRLTIPQDSGAVTTELRSASAGWTTGSYGE